MNRLFIRRIAQGLLILWAAFQFTALSAQDFMMQGWYWDYPKPGCNGVSAASPSWAATLRGLADNNQLNGFTYLWLPPFSRASFGNCSNGYDPKDLYDLGEYGLGATGFGTRPEVNLLISALNAKGIQGVADVVYNHRDGGNAEPNSAVKAYIEQFMSTGKNPFPSDRFRCYLPVGDGSSYGAGDYYFKISSKTGGFGSTYGYKVYMNTLGNAGEPFQGTTNEVEPNGGGDCNQGNNDIILNQDMQAYLGSYNSCNTDEFHLNLSASKILSGGDRLTIYLNNIAGGYSDHRIYGIWYDPEGPAPGFNVNMADLVYETYTDFTNMPSNQGEMNFEYFKPNSNNAATTYLAGDWDWLWFFYDYDQFQPQTANALSDWTEWLWDNVGIRGFRMDAVKHFTPGLPNAIMNNLKNAGKTPGMVVGEFYDANPTTLNNWVTQAQSGLTGVQMRAFDFALREALKSATNLQIDVRDVFSSGMVEAVGANAHNVVTFLNNHDFRSAGDYIADPLLAYVYLFTNNQVGLPCVFYPDYFGINLGYAQPPALKTQIDALINLHSTYIYNASDVRYLNRHGTTYQSNFISGYTQNTLFYQINDGPTGQKILVVINFANVSLKMDHQADAAPGTAFAKIMGTTNGTDAPVVGVSSPPPGNVPNYVYLDIPARSYAIFVETGVLPVELLSFDVYRKGAGARLEWATAGEEHFDAFEVERSRDCRQFHHIGRVEGKGLTGIGSSYAYTDNGLWQNGLYYYRLKMVDADGSFEYSPIRTVEAAFAVETLAAIPNPAREEALLQWAGASEGTATLSVYSILGELTYRQPIETHNGANQFRLGLSGRKPGLYLIEIQGPDGQIWAGSLMVQ
ncbi:MAG: T9SS type A sorting domain-containing protein [Phaeodactylibacter sp.]|nr:T9SS type A sorting domain-containing protein [Phaeodactylibacter sp.]